MPLYKCFHKGRQIEVEAGSSHAAQLKAAIQLKVKKKTWEITVVLLSLDGKTPVVHTPVD